MLHLTHSNYIPDELVVKMCTFQWKFGMCLNSSEMKISLSVLLLEYELYGQYT